MTLEGPGTERLRDTRLLTYRPTPPSYTPPPSRSESRWSPRVGDPVGLETRGPKTAVSVPLVRVTQ